MWCATKPSSLTFFGSLNDVYSMTTQIGLFTHGFSQPIQCYTTHAYKYVSWCSFVIFWVDNHCGGKHVCIQAMWPSKCCLCNGVLPPQVEGCCNSHSLCFYAPLMVPLWWMCFKKSERKVSGLGCLAMRHTIFGPFTCAQNLQKRCPYAWCEGCGTYVSDWVQ